MKRSTVAGAAIVAVGTLIAIFVARPPTPIQHPDSGKARDRLASAPREMPPFPEKSSASGSRLPLPDAEAGAWTIIGNVLVSVELKDGLAVPALTLHGSGTLTVRVLNGSGEPAGKAEIAILDEEGEDQFDLMRALGESGIIAELVLNGERIYHRLPRGRYRLRGKEWVGDGPFGPEIAVDLGREPAEVTLTLP